MTPGLRRLLAPALLVVTVVAAASMLAVPDEPPIEEITPEEIRAMDDFVRQFQLGQRLFGRGDDEKAERVFRDLLEIEPDAAAVHHALATVLGFRGRAEESTQHFLRAAELAPGDVAIQRDAGLDLLRHGRAGDAEPYLGRARRIWPEDVEILVAHGTCLRALGRDVAATAAYRAAVAVQPESVDARVGLAGSILEEDPAEAVRLVERASHNFADVSLVHGLALVRLHRVEDAVPHLLMAARRSPANAAGAAVLAAASRELGRVGAAEEAAQAAALWCAGSGTPPALEPSLALAEALAALGRPGEALEALRQGRMKGAPAPVVRRGRLVTASLLARMGRGEDARTILTELADDEADTPERTLARFALGRVDLDALTAALGDAPELRNDRAWAQAVRAWIEGDDAAAADHAREARELSEPAGEFPALLVR